MKLQYLFFGLAFSLLLAGCSSQAPTPTGALDPHAEVQAENNLFLQQTNFDPWVLVSTDPDHQIPAYLPSGAYGTLYGPLGAPSEVFHAGVYDKNGVIVSDTPVQLAGAPASSEYRQTLDLQHGTLSTVSETSSTKAKSHLDWPSFWSKSDISIVGDPEAQQVTHVELFDLCGSLAPGSDHSIPPMGLSSDVYDGHIFWDAEIWMLPALLPQHPELAKSIVDYRFERLQAATDLAKEHGFAGAEYPWESASTGLEQAPEEFSHERHITADIAYAAWQYFLWTGDTDYLKREGWPLLSATANYWASRASLGQDGHYHIAGVIGPDETAGQVTDDAWTNAAAQYNLRAATDAAALTNHVPGAKWAVVADKMLIPYDPKTQLILQYPAMDVQRSQAKQADAQMLIYPLNLKVPTVAASNTLDYYVKHTIAFGPAMTSSINATIAARLGRTEQAIDLYRSSYRPFMRGPWDAFSEKRTKSDVYFTTGIGGSLQTVLYGFGGLNVVQIGALGNGKLIAATKSAALYCDPHLPAGWTDLTIKGVKFQGNAYDIEIKQGNTVTVTKKM